MYLLSHRFPNLFRPPPPPDSYVCPFSSHAQLLNKDGIEVDLLTYNVTSFDETTGLVEWVEDARTVRSIGDAGGIRKFLQLMSDTPENQRKLKRFQNSLAFYSVANLLLAFGDRHRDNMMVCRDGRFFHIDFGYIFGVEPKPFCQ
jgi:phosphatidylinositol 3-kinase